MTLALSATLRGARQADLVGSVAGRLDRIGAIHGAVLKPANADRSRNRAGTRVSNQAKRQKKTTQDGSRAELDESTSSRDPADTRKVDA